MDLDGLLIALLVLGVGLYLARLVRREGQPAALVALQVFLLVVGATALWQTNSDQEDTAADTQELSQRLDRAGVRAIADVRAVVAAQREIQRNCRLDLKARRQYKLRAEVERKTINLQAIANATLADVSSALARGDDKTVTRLLRRLARVSQRVSERQVRLAGRIRILPIRRCTIERRRAARRAAGPIIGQPLVGGNALSGSERSSARR
jgi:hypothetical protein